MREGTQEFIVTSAHSAANMGSGELSVLATPALIAFAEQTCKDLIAPELEVQETTVGSFIQLEHQRPSQIGAKIKVVARLRERTKNKVTYEFNAYEEEQLIAKGEHQRVIVNRETFMGRLKK